MPNIPGKPPFQPKIPGPEGTPPEVGKKFTVAAGFVDQSGRIFEKFVNIEKVQYWQRRLSQDIECDDVFERQETFSVGVSATTLAEVASQLSVGNDQVAATLTQSLQQSITLSAESTVSKFIRVSAPDCSGVTFAFWQLVDEYRIAVTTEGLFGSRSTKTTTIVDPQEVFDLDKIVYTKRGCCPRRVAMLLRDGFNTPYSVTFAGVQVILLGKISNDGLVSLAGTAGRFPLGDGVPASALPGDVAEQVLADRRGETDAFGALELYEGPRGPIFNAVNRNGRFGIERAERRLLRLLNEGDRETLSEASNFELGSREIDVILTERGRARNGFDSLGDTAVIERDTLRKLTTNLGQPLTIRRSPTLPDLVQPVSELR